MNILVVGSGGREHSICWLIKKSPIVKKLYCLPGNAGIDEIAICLPEEDPANDSIIKICKKLNIELVVIGPEAYLANGLADALLKEKIKVFGPNKSASLLESSKSFTKDLCLKNNIPTAKYKTFSQKSNAKKYLEKQKYPIVIKADGLASGKGVIIAKSIKESFIAIDQLFDGKYGDAGKTIVIEEFLEGIEASFFAISDGNVIKPFSTAQDYKRAYDNNEGPNTGGMGAFSPARNIDKDLEKKIMNLIISPTFNALKDKGITYKGILYAGLMIKDNSPKLIEYNVRFGDPECQVILPRLKSDIVSIMIAVCDGKLDEIKIEWLEISSLIVIMATKGYPNKYPLNTTINGLENIISKESIIFHSGTKLVNKEIKSNGGRVLGITSLASTLDIAREKSYKSIEKISWPNGFYRKDIGNF
ncbi:MAG: Phosphoribosylamine--glycine ligase [Alphaproteobacteria bacterium MarineAlpha2_Bin1]|nr:MAG: Phosphoribosylamine--glycine ligase [Alphaproteobacteria bacterium MarineAlpha2_Bin1]|tara:strand:- start:1386 stop:2639 length:1254 start_codon:yes stop_codon:yes gene_type:complete